jgi:hypothetical protein
MVTPDQFRDLALAHAGATESEHMQHPDFRVGGKIFATLGPDLTWAMVKLAPPEQADLVARCPAVFEPIPGAWGARGATKIHLAKAKRQEVKEALLLAWQNTAPKRLKLKE